MFDTNLFEFKLKWFHKFDFMTANGKILQGKSDKVTMGKGNTCKLLRVI